MKLHGWCIKCRKVKRVNVSSAALARGGVLVGECDACRDKR